MMRKYCKDFWTEFRSDMIKTHVWAVYTVLYLVHSLTGFVLRALDA